MPGYLVLMRHAKSAWDEHVDNDFDRPLAPRGERDAPRIARWLRERIRGPFRIVSSPALRARQTATVLAHELGLTVEDIEWRRGIYEATVQELLSTLSATGADDVTVVLIGHNPGLEELASYLADPHGLPDEPKIMPTAGVICLELPPEGSRLRQGGCRVVAHMRPRWLKGN